MPALAISMKKNSYTSKIYKQKIKFLAIYKWYCKVYFYDNFTFKTQLNFLHCMLSRTL